MYIHMIYISAPQPQPRKKSKPGVYGSSGNIFLLSQITIPSWLHQMKVMKNHAQWWRMMTNNEKTMINVYKLVWWTRKVHCRESLQDLLCCYALAAILKPGIRWRLKQYPDNIAIYCIYIPKKNINETRVSQLVYMKYMNKQCSNASWRCSFCIASRLRQEYALTEGGQPLRQKWRHALCNQAARAHSPLFVALILYTCMERQNETYVMFVLMISSKQLSLVMEPPGQISHSSGIQEPNSRIR